MYVSTSESQRQVVFFSNHCPKFDDKHHRKNVLKHVLELFGGMLWMHGCSSLYTARMSNGSELRSTALGVNEDWTMINITISHSPDDIL